MAPRVLVEPDDLAAFLAIDLAEYPAEALDPIRMGVVRFFERLCGRKELPFSDAITGRVEYHDGNGDALLWLDYPVAALTSITIGTNHAAPSETLAVNDANALSFVLGDRVLQRLDGGTFGEFDALRAVKATYNTAADLPEDARLACLRLIAQIWRQRGSEDASQETVSGYARTMVDMAATDAVWKEAVKFHTRAVLR